MFSSPSNHANIPASDIAIQEIGFSKSSTSIMKDIAPGELVFVNIQHQVDSFQKFSEKMDKCLGSEVSSPVSTKKSKGRGKQRRYTLTRTMLTRQAFRSIAYLLLQSS
ncbi:hypothetical protein ACH5RR_032210 [Cinchona calisaya]|uniref:Uncharacterized protein n=1 Tax=Cinchona calisaya TaxID=153742 RepID=A0ABD2YIJ3_9GENT